MSNWTSTRTEFLNSSVWFEKEGKEQDEYASKFCCCLVCHIILRISI